MNSKDTQKQAHGESGNRSRDKSYNEGYDSDNDKIEGGPKIWQINEHTERRTIKRKTYRDTETSKETDVRRAIDCVWPGVV